MKFFTIIGLASAAKLTQKVAQREVPITDGAVGGFNPAADTTGGYEAGTTDGYEGAWVGTTGGQYDTGATMQNDDWNTEMQGNNWEDKTGPYVTGAGDDGMDYHNHDITGNTGGADDACYDAAGDWNYICDTTGGTDGASTGAAMQDDWSSEMQGNNWEDKDNTGWSVTGGDNGMAGMTTDDMMDMYFDDGAPVATGGQWTDEEVAEFLEDDTMGDHTDDNQWANDYSWAGDYDEGWESDNTEGTHAAGGNGDDQWPFTTFAGDYDYEDYTNDITEDGGYKQGWDDGYLAATEDAGYDDDDYCSGTPMPTDC